MTIVLCCGRSKRLGAALAVVGAVVLGAAALVACSSEPSAGTPTRAPGAGGCATPVTRIDDAAEALKRVEPGDTVCLHGNDVRDAELELTRSGTADRPITVTGDGAVIKSLSVKADHVIVENLTFQHGEGLTLFGRGLVVRGNTIEDARDDGIVCADCQDSTLERNTVRRADGTGIFLAGERVIVRDNTVTESVALTRGDADGIRFFGVGHRLLGNTIKDLKASGYEEDPRGGPHTDCFQTYNTMEDPFTADVVIAGNTCTNVDVQCLIATAQDDVRYQPTAVSGPSIVFEHNVCEVNGSQAVLLQNFPDVVVRDNVFSGPGYRAVFVGQGSTGCSIIGNTVSGAMQLYEIDDPSRPGFVAENNVRR